MCRPFLFRTWPNGALLAHLMTVSLNAPQGNLDAIGIDLECDSHPAEFCYVLVDSTDQRNTLVKPVRRRFIV